MFAVDFSRAMLLEPTAGAILLIGLKLHEQVMADPGVFGFQPHRLTGRTPAGLVIGIDLEVHLGDADLLLALVAFFRCLEILEPRVSGSETGIGEIAVDALIFEKLEGGLVIVARVGCELGLLACFYVGLEGLLHTFHHGLK